MGGPTQSGAVAQLAWFAFFWQRTATFETFVRRLEKKKSARPKL